MRGSWILSWACVLLVSTIASAGDRASGQPGDVRPVDAIYDIPARIEAMGLPAGIEASLMAKAMGAIDAFERGWPDRMDVVPHLDALLHAIRALGARVLPSADALALADFVRSVRELLAAPIITCALPAGITFPATVEECEAAGGGVWECIAAVPGHGEGEAKGKPAIALVSYNETDVLGPMAGWATNLTNAVAASGVTTTKYVAGKYNCVSFTTALQTYLNAHGYTTSFTVVYKKNPSTGKIATGHAIVDVKAPDGTVLFVEPQDGSNPDLDFDHDGVTEVATGHPSGPSSGWPMTDDNVRIEVYADQQAARQAGCPV